MLDEERVKGLNVRGILAIILLLQIIIFIIRIISGIELKSSVLLIEGIHILVDLSITSAVLMASKIITGSYARRYSYGLYRLDDLIAFIIAILVAYSALEIASGSIHPVLNYSLYPSIIQFLTLIPLFLAGILKVKAGKSLNLKSLIEDGRHTYSDVYEGMGVGIGLSLFSIFQNMIFYYISILIAVLAIIYTSFSIGKNSLISLLDLPKDKNIFRKVREIIISKDGVTALKDLRLRWAGPVIFGEATITVKPTLTIWEAHKIADDVEKSIYENLKDIKSISIHVEPNFRNMRIVLLPTENGKISETVSRSKEFTLIKIDDNGIKEEKIYSNASSRFQRNFYQICMENEVTDVICKKIGENTKAMLRGMGIQIWVSGSIDVEVALEGFKKGDLKPMD